MNKIDLIHKCLFNSSKINFYKRKTFEHTTALHTEKVGIITVYVNFISPAFTTHDTIVPFVVMF